MNCPDIRQLYLFFHAFQFALCLKKIFLFQQLAVHMPARTQGYPWQLVYSTAVHGSSLKTLYRNMAGLDSPVLLVIKDMHKKVSSYHYLNTPYVQLSCV